MKEYRIEFYDTKKEVGKGFTYKIYNNLEEAIEDADTLQNHLVKEDAEHTIFLVNEIETIKNEDNEVIEENNTVVYETSNK